MQFFDHSRIGLITGCGKGIGFSCLSLFLESNPKNIAIAISRSDSIAMNNLKSLYPSRLFFLESDISDFSRVRNWLSHIFITVGFPDFAILNAGIRSRISIKDASLEDYRSVFEINTLSQIHLVKTLLDLRPSNNDCLKICAISSIVGSRGFDALSTYGVSKAALEGFVRSSAVELADDNFIINSLNPGFTKSSYATSFREDKKDLYNWTISKTPMGRWAECDEVAKYALFLVSDMNTYTTGSVVYCDGGWTAQ